jgi:hypothetical protein
MLVTLCRFLRRVEAARWRRWKRLSSAWRTEMIERRKV